MAHHRIGGRICEHLCPALDLSTPRFLLDTHDNGARDARSRVPCRGRIGEAGKTQVILVGMKHDGFAHYVCLVRRPQGYDRVYERARYGTIRVGDHIAQISRVSSRIVGPSVGLAVDIQVRARVGAII